MLITIATVEYVCRYNHNSLFVKEALGTTGICVKGKLLPDPGSEALTHVHDTITPDRPTGNVQEWYVKGHASFVFFFTILRYSSTCLFKICVYSVVALALVALDQREYCT